MLIYGGAKEKKKGKEKENPLTRLLETFECVETEHEGLPFLNFQTTFNCCSELESTSFLVIYYKFF